MSFPPPRESGSNWGGAGQAGGSPNRFPTGTVQLPRLTNQGGVAQGGYGGGYTSQNFPVVALPSTPTYPSMSTRNLPPRRALDSIARRSRPRWGLRFLFLLIFVGGTAYAGREYIPWVNTRVIAVEQSVRELGRQYGFLDGAPAPLARPSGTLPETAPDIALARAGNAGVGGRPLGRPDIQPIATAPSVPRAGQAGLMAGVRGGFPGARGGLAAVRAGQPGARAAGLPPAAAPRAVRGYGRRKLAAAGAPAAPRQRLRRRFNRSANVAAAANAATAALVASAQAAPAAAAPVKAEAPVAEKPAPSEAAKPAANSGDELDQLMASAVGGGPGAARSDLDKKLSTVQKGEAGTKAVKAESKPALGRDEIKAVMADVQKEMNDCMRKTGQGGPVDVKIEIAPDGDVKNTLIKGAMAGTATGACVESKIKATVFPAGSGQSIDYRLLVR
jgi:hypothetical protein